MIRERVDTGAQQYDIVIGPGLLQRTGSFLEELNVKKSSRHLVVTDANVEKAGHLARVSASLSEAGYGFDVMVIPAGEDSKSLELAAEAYDRAYKAGLDRRSIVVALGGGVVGDFAGFVAATYMRGIDFVQLPTTLLAHDSAVGGKVAVNLPHAKNMIGAFHQPLAVLYDTEALHTLPPRELRSGLAEAIKHGVIRDAELFHWIDANVEGILRVEDDVMAELLARSCRVKVEVVSEDEKEHGLRAILNFGHTFGHAVEWATDFTHGESVAVGMVAEAELSADLGYCDQAAVAEVKRVIAKAGLPSVTPADLPVEELMQAMRQDKKATGGDLTFVLMRGIGEVEIVKAVPEAPVRKMIAQSTGQ